MESQLPNTTDTADGFSTEVYTDTADGFSTEVYTEYTGGYTGVVQMVAKIYYPIVLFVGLSGNTMNLLVLSRKTMLTLSSTVYLLGLSISDIFLLIYQTLFKYLIYKTWWVTDPHGFHVYLCVYNHWLLVGGIRSSFWIVVSLTIERYIAITFPLRGKVWCTKSKAKKVVPSVAIAGYLYALYENWVREVTDDGWCILTSWGESAADALSIMNATVYTLTYVLLATFNGLVIYQLKKPNGRRKLSAANQAGTREHSQNTRGTLVLLTLSAVFLLLNLPWLLNYLIFGMPDNGASGEGQHGLEILAEFVGSLNPTVNFFLYSLLSKRYRAELVVLCRQRRERLSNRRGSSSRRQAAPEMAAAAAAATAATGVGSRTSGSGGRKLSTMSWPASDTAVSSLGAKRWDSPLTEDGIGLYDYDLSQVTLISVKNSNLPL